jgi:ribosomal protein S18 acetylase RimI-like enzyme
MLNGRYSIGDNVLKFISSGESQPHSVRVHVGPTKPPFVFMGYPSDCHQIRSFLIRAQPQEFACHRLSAHGNDTENVESSADFRKFEEADLDAVLNLCAGEDWTSYTADRARAHQVFTAPGVASFVAIVGGEVVGFAYCQTDGAIQAHLSLIVVDERNRQAGIARALVAYAFPLLGATRIDLITDSAGAFYRALPHKEQLGFRLYTGTE